MRYDSACLIINAFSLKDIETEMSCAKIWREIPNYIEDKHGAPLRASIEEHLKNCKHCIGEE